MIISSTPTQPYQLLLLSARTETALEVAAKNLRAYLQQHPAINLAEVAYRLQVGHKTFGHRRVIVCSSCEEAIQALETLEAPQVLSRKQKRGGRPVAFLLPGVGEQYNGMAQDLYEQTATFRQIVDHCCTFLYKHLGLNLQPALFLQNTPVKLSSDDGQENQGKLNLHVMLGRERSHIDSNKSDQLTSTALAQPAVFVIEYALAQLLMQWGIWPKALLGYSLGEYVAACVAGVLSLEEALLLIARRAQLIQTMPAGVMVAVPLSKEEVQSYLNKEVCLAAVNGPRLCVLAGPVAAIERLETTLRQQELLSLRLKTTHAFHSTMLAPLKEAVTDLVRQCHLRIPQVPYISNVTGTWITKEQATDPGYWAEHMCQPVLYARGLEHLLQRDANERLLLEVGPGQVLSSMVKQHPACGQEQRALVFATLPSAYERRSAQRYLLTTVGKLWLSGVMINWAGFWQSQQHPSLPV